MKSCLAGINLKETLFTHSFIHSFILSFVRSFVHSYLFKNKLTDCKKQQDVFSSVHLPYERVVKLNVTSAFSMSTTSSSTYSF